MEDEKKYFLIKIEKEIFFKNNQEKILKFQIKRIEKKFKAKIWLLDFEKKIAKSSKFSKRVLDNFKQIEEKVNKIPMNSKCFIIKSTNPLLDLELIETMNQNKNYDTPLSVYGAIPGTAPEICLKNTDIIPYLKNKKLKKNIIFWKTQKEANNQFNLKRPIRIKLFLGLLKKIKNLDNISIKSILRILEKKEIYNYLLDYCEKVDVKNLKTCPNCKSNNKKPLNFSSSQPTIGFLSSKIPAYYECLDCGLGYLRRQCSFKDLKKFYDEYERPKEEQKKIITNLVEKKSGTHFNEKIQIVKTLKKSIKDNSIITDLGCGFGEFACLLKNTNSSWNVNAVDFDLEHIKIILKNNSVFPISKNFVEEYDLPSDAITLLHVIEHIPFVDLKKLIVNIEHNLKPGGIFVVSTPNLNSELAKFFDYHLMFPPIHQTIFSDEWLRQYIEKNTNLKLIEKKSASVILENFEGWFTYFLENAPTDEQRSTAKLFFDFRKDVENFEKFHNNLNEQGLGSEVILFFEKAKTK